MSSRRRACRRGPASFRCPELTANQAATRALVISYGFYFFFLFSSRVATLGRRDSDLAAPFRMKRSRIVGIIADGREIVRVAPLSRDSDSARLPRDFHARSEQSGCGPAVSMTTRRVAYQRSPSVSHSLVSRSNLATSVESRDANGFFACPSKKHALFLSR